MANRILIVDDEPDILEILRFNLEIEGYEVFTADNPLEAQEIVDGRTINLILLDVMMTPKSGFDWARELKSDQRTAGIPIIFCTAKTLEEDLLLGFALGSDDYICKPFCISEVKARVKAVLRRTANISDLTHTRRLLVSDFPREERGDTAEIPDHQHSNNTMVYKGVSPRGNQEEGGIVLDLDRKECFVDGKEVVFTKLEFEVLALLLSKPGQVFSREKILNTVWPSDTIVLTRTVDVNITRIRKKIGRYGELLRTKFGYGYMFGK